MWSIKLQLKIKRMRTILIYTSTGTATVTCVRTGKQKYEYTHIYLISTFYFTYSTIMNCTQCKGKFLFVIKGLPSRVVCDT